MCMHTMQMMHGNVGDSRGAGGAGAAFHGMAPRRSDTTPGLFAFSPHDRSQTFTPPTKTDLAALGGIDEASRADHRTLGDDDGRNARTADAAATDRDAIQASVASLEAMENAQLVAVAAAGKGAAGKRGNAVAATAGSKPAWDYDSGDDACRDDAAGQTHVADHPDDLPADAANAAPTPRDETVNATAAGATATVPPWRLAKRPAAASLDVVPRKAAKASTLAAAVAAASAAAAAAAKAATLAITPAAKAAAAKAAAAKSAAAKAAPAKAAAAKAAAAKAAAAKPAAAAPSHKHRKHGIDYSDLLLPEIARGAKSKGAFTSKAYDTVVVRARTKHGKGDAKIKDAGRSAYADAVLVYDRVVGK